MSDDGRAKGFDDAGFHMPFAQWVAGVAGTAGVTDGDPLEALAAPVPSAYTTELSSIAGTTVRVATAASRTLPQVSGDGTVVVVTCTYDDSDLRSVLMIECGLLARLMDHGFGMGAMQPLPRLDLSPSPAELRLASHLADVWFGHVDAALGGASSRTVREQVTEAAAWPFETTESWVSIIEASAETDLGALALLISPAAELRLRRSVQRRQPSTDANWSDRIVGELQLTDVVLTALVDGPTMNVSELTALSVGDVIDIPSIAEADVRLCSHSRELARSRLARSGGHFALIVGALES